MKKWSLILFLCILTHPLYAEENNGMTLQDFLQEAENDDNLQQQLAESAELFDVNSDNKISINEINQATTGLEGVPENLYTNAEKTEIKNYFLQAFYESDVNKDNALTGEEQTTFVKACMIYTLKQQFRKMDRNGDGIINENDMPTLEESEQQLEEAVKLLDEVKNKLETTSPDEIADNWMKGMQTAIADEIYYQMDNNHDNCVTQAEYVDYKAQQEEKKPTDETTAKIHNMRAVYAYLTIKKASPDCLTKDEYIEDENRPIEEVLKEEPDEEMKKRYAETLFETMDRDNNKELTTEEYVAYKSAEYKEMCTKCIEIADIYTSLFNNAAPSGKMNRDEFIAFYITENNEDEDGDVDENWFNKSDINKDGCIDMAEYVQAETVNEDDALKEMDDLQTKRIYLELNKTTPNCLTKEDIERSINQNADELIARYHRFDENVERQYAEEVFAVADKNADNKISLDEFAAYRKKEHEYYTKDLKITYEDTDQDEREKNMFLQKAPQGFMEKDEFIKDKVEAARRVHDIITKK